jgi:hypothetical protein
MPSGPLPSNVLGCVVLLVRWRTKLQAALEERVASIRRLPVVQVYGSASQIGWTAGPNAVLEMLLIWVSFYCPPG